MSLSQTPPPLLLTRLMAPIELVLVEKEPRMMVEAEIVMSPPSSPPSVPQTHALIIELMPEEENKPNKVETLSDASSVLPLSDGNVESLEKPLEEWAIKVENIRLALPEPEKEGETKTAPPSKKVKKREKQKVKQKIASEMKTEHAEKPALKPHEIQIEKWLNIKNAPEFVDKADKYEKVAAQMIAEWTAIEVFRKIS